MMRGIGWFTRVLLAPVSWAKLTRKPPLGKGRMRRRTILLCSGAMLIAMSIGTYVLYFRPPPAIADPVAVTDDKQSLPEDRAFEQLAKSDPVAMLEKCLVKYQRDVVSGVRCTLDKEERVKEELLPREVISLAVRGDVPDPSTNKTHIEVLMKWQSGMQKVLGSELKGTLYVEKLGGNKDPIITWRPSAPFFKEKEIGVNDDSAKNASRYCIRDAGPYRGMLRTYEVWKERKAEGTLITEYLGRKPIEKAGGAECHIVKRVCRSPEVDAFELGGTPDMSPKKVAQVGFNELTIMIDTKLWLQVGTELRRANGDLIGAYYFRDIDLKPSFPAETFNKDGLLKK
jgi:hypothetical protein